MGRTRYYSSEEDEDEEIQGVTTHRFKLRKIGVEGNNMCVLKNLRRRVRKALTPQDWEKEGVDSVKDDEDEEADWVEDDLVSEELGGQEEHEYDGEEPGGSATDAAEGDGLQGGLTSDLDGIAAAVSKAREKMKSLEKEQILLKSIIEAKGRIIRELTLEVMSIESEKRRVEADNCRQKHAAESCSRQLENMRDTALKQLEHEQEKRKCRICYDRPWDTISLPCLHLHFCLECLEKHQQRTKTCPTCRGFISGLLKCNIPMP